MKNILAAIMLMGATVSVDAMMLPAATNKANTPTKMKKIGDMFTTSFFSAPANAEEQQAWQELLEKLIDSHVEMPSLESVYAFSTSAHNESNQTTALQQANNIEHRRCEEITQIYRQLIANVNAINAPSVKKQNLRAMHIFSVPTHNKDNSTELPQQTIDTDYSDEYYSDYSEAYYSDYSYDEGTE